MTPRIRGSDAADMMHMAAAAAAHDAKVASGEVDRDMAAASSAYAALPPCPIVQALGAARYTADGARVLDAWAGTAPAGVLVQRIARERDRYGRLAAGKGCVQEVYGYAGGYRGFTCVSIDGSEKLSVMVEYDKYRG